MGDRDVSTLGDADLLLAASGGDENAWQALVDRHGRIIWAVVRSHRLRPSDAADAFQTTWLRLVENLHTISQPERVGSWLVTTARREALRLHRLRGRELPEPREPGDDTRPDTAAGPEELAVLDDDRAAVARAFGKLSTRCQILLRLWLDDRVQGNTGIASRLGMPVGSVGPTRSRCLAHLRRFLGEVTPR